MSKIPSPVLLNIKEDSSFLNDFEARIRTLPTDKAETLLNYPVVYIHYWPSERIAYTTKGGNIISYNKYDVYVGESIDIIQRTREHYQAGSDHNVWQYNLVRGKKDGCTPHIIVIGHKHFNKSFTLDVENRLIAYVLSMQRTVSNSYNGRGNPQNLYYPPKEFNEVFNKIWSGLRRIKGDLFLSQTEIEHSAIFKASPLKKLFPEQIEAKEHIIQKVCQAYKSGKDGQLIFVQGEAGTGKTVLTTSTFYDLLKRGEESPVPGEPPFPKLDCHLMVNHDQQVLVYEQIAKRLLLGDNIVSKPTAFINSHKPSEKVDVSFIDEGHLLWTQGKQRYQGNNQLRDIIDRSRVTVLMFDEFQVLTTEEYWEPNVLSTFKDLSINQGNYIELKNQLRMLCSDSTSEWITNFVLNRKLSKFLPDEKGYEVLAFDSPDLLHQAIRKKSSKSESLLSRVVASYDWDYNKKKRPTAGNYWGVSIGDWFLPWNYELKRNLVPKQKRDLKQLAWAEQPQTINEVGSTFTIQGFDLSYVGVILGPSVQYRNDDGQIIFNPSKSKSKNAVRNRTLSDGSKRSFGEIFIRNEVKVLLTRGIKGLYIYACDDNLRRALKEIANIPFFEGKKNQTV